MYSVVLWAVCCSQKEENRIDNAQDLCRQTVNYGEATVGAGLVHQDL